MKENRDVMYIAKECALVGNIVAKGRFKVDGQIEGKINVEGEVIVGDSAKVNANIEADIVKIAGEVFGNVKANELFEISSTGRFFGDVNTKSLKIDQGARFIGNSIHSDTAKLEAKEESTVDKLIQPAVFNRRPDYKPQDVMSTNS